MLIFFLGNGTLFSNYPRQLPREIRAKFNIKVYFFPLVLTVKCFVFISLKLRFFHPVLAINTLLQHVITPFMDATASSNAAAGVLDKECVILQTERANLDV